MSTMNRRDFMRTSAGVMAGAFAAQALSHGTAVAQAAPATPATLAPAAFPKATSVRTLGKTGIQCTLVGMGTGMQGFGHSSALTRQGKDIALATLRHAYDRGITFFDVADQYGSHGYLREAMQNGIPREKITILTKTWERDPVVVRADMDRFRMELDTDILDIVLMHCLTVDRDTANWPEKLKPCMDVLAEAKAKGVVRAVGCSCHSIEALRLAVEHPWVDVNLVRINPAGERMDGPPEEVAPLIQKAHEAGHAVLAMKVVGEGALRDKIPESLRYVLGLGAVDAMTIGFQSPQEIDGFIAHVDGLTA